MVRAAAVQLFSAEAFVMVFIGVKLLDARVLVRDARLAVAVFFCLASIYGGGDRGTGFSQEIKPTSCSVADDCVGMLLLRLSSLLRV